MKIFGLHIITDKELNRIAHSGLPEDQPVAVLIAQYRDSYMEARGRAIELQQSYQDLLAENTQLNIAMGKVADMKDLLDSFERIKSILRKQ